MAIATYTQLRASAGTITEGLIRKARSVAEKDLFLSHSQEDSDYVRPALALLEHHGASVYVDLQDTAIKELTGPQIGARIRKAVTTCRRLIVIVTEETRTSRWIPWEMGLADGVAGSGQVVLLPLKPSVATSELWAHQSYFGLYGKIGYVTLKGDSAPCWAVSNPANGGYWRLRSWIKNTAPSRRQALR